MNQRKTVRDHAVDALNRADAQESGFDKIAIIERALQEAWENGATVGACLENEACAELAGRGAGVDFDEGDQKTCDHIAAAIRARGAKS